MDPPIPERGVVVSASSDRLTAVDDHGVADDGGGCVRTEPEDGGGDFVRSAHPSDRRPVRSPGLALGGAASEPMHHFGVDDPGADGVDADDDDA